MEVVENITGLHTLWVDPCEKFEVGVPFLFRHPFQVGQGILERFLIASPDWNFQTWAGRIAILLIVITGVLSRHRTFTQIYRRWGRAAHLLSSSTQFLTTLRAMVSDGLSDVELPNLRDGGHRKAGSFGWGPTDGPFTRAVRGLVSLFAALSGALRSLATAVLCAPRTFAVLLIVGFAGNVVNVGYMMASRVADPDSVLAGGIEPTNLPKRLYAIMDGDTLESIAENELGDNERWQQIYELNSELFESLGASGVLAVGILINLPAENYPAANRDANNAHKEQLKASEVVLPVANANSAASRSAPALFIILIIVLLAGPVFAALRLNTLLHRRQPSLRGFRWG